MNHFQFMSSGSRVLRFRLATRVAMAGVLLMLLPSVLVAQAKKAPQQTFEEVSLDTKDGVIVVATYYPGPEKKTTVPLILVHDWEGNRTDLHMLAHLLQQSGHAVIVPDLRGHGTSVRVRGVDRPIDRDKMKPRDLELMLLDIEAAKSFLLQRNNDEKLNIEQLGVLGTGFGATLALNWAVRDWNARSLPTYKMGQDVKAIMLISPRSLKGYSANMALKDRSLAYMSALVVVGTQDATRYADAKKIFKAFQNAHPDTDPDAARFYEANTSLQGIDLIYDRELRVPDWISGCIKTRLADRATDLPWTDRTSPLNK